MTEPNKGFKDNSASIVSDPIDIEGRAQANFTYTGTAGQSAALAEGLYDVWSDQNCYLKVDRTDASDVTSSTGYLLLANNFITMRIRKSSKLGAIQKTTGGTLSFHRVG